MAALFSPEWWKKEESPRWALAVGALLMLALSTLIQFGLSERGRVAEQRAEQVQALLDSMVQFQSFASAFSAEMFAEQRVSAETRSRLIENLNEQYARVRRIEPFLPPETKELAETYKHRLLEMATAVDNTEDILSMQDFWSSASDLLVARNRLNDSLQSTL